MSILRVFISVVAAAVGVCLLYGAVSIARLAIIPPSFQWPKNPFKGAAQVAQILLSGGWGSATTVGVATLGLGCLLLAAYVLFSRPSDDAMR